MVGMSELPEVVNEFSAGDKLAFSMFTFVRRLRHEGKFLKRIPTDVFTMSNFNGTLNSYWVNRRTLGKKDYSKVLQHWPIIYSPYMLKGYELSNRIGNDVRGVLPMEIYTPTQELTHTGAFSQNDALTHFDSENLTRRLKYNQDDTSTLIVFELTPRALTTDIIRKAADNPRTSRDNSSYLYIRGSIKVLYVPKLPVQELKKYLLVNGRTLVNKKEFLRDLYSISSPKEFMNFFSTDYLPHSASYTCVTARDINVIIEYRVLDYMKKIL